MTDSISRRDLIKNVALATAGIGLVACQRPQASANTAANDTAFAASAAPANTDEARLDAWAATVRREALTRDDIPLGRSATRVGELAVGTPYEAFTLEAYLPPARRYASRVNASRRTCAPAAARRVRSR